MKTLSNIIRRRIVAYVLVSVLALSVGATLTVAAGIAGGVITACYNLGTGVLRIETQTAPCVMAGDPLLMEDRITWNQVGPQGAIGATGPQGPKGDKGDGLVWRGQYGAATSYAVNDAVESYGASYVASAPVAATSCARICIDRNAPGLNPAWQLLAAKGNQGAAGQAGSPGAQGAQGPRGPSDVYTSMVGTKSMPLTGGAVQAGSLTLPTGKYLLLANASVEAVSTVTCAIRDTSGGTFGSGFANVMTTTIAIPYGATSFSTAFTTIPIMAVVDVTGMTATVLVECSGANAGLPNQLLQATFVAIQVEATH